MRSGLARMSGEHGLAGFRLWVGRAAIPRGRAGRLVRLAAPLCSTSGLTPRDSVASRRASR